MGYDRINKKVYIRNQFDELISPKVIEFSKIKPYYRKVKFHQTKEERRIKYWILIAIVIVMIAIYLSLLFFSTSNHSEINNFVDSATGQVVNTKEDADILLGFETISINKLPDNYQQRTLKVDVDKKIYKTHFLINKENNMYNNIILIQKKTKLTPVIGTVDGNEAQYASLGASESELNNYVNLLNKESSNDLKINIVMWHDNNFEYALIGDVGIEELSKFISDNLDKEISFKITNIK